MLIYLLSFAFCAINIYDYGDGFEMGYVRVFFQVTPDDARIYLNEKFIGYCYEFNTERTALKLKNRSGFLTIKKEGYLEEEIDLKRISPKSTMAIKLNLKPDVYSKDSPRQQMSVAEERAEPAKPAETVKQTQPGQSTTDKWRELILNSNQDDVAVWIDSRFWGIVSTEKSSIFLEPGKHLLEAFKPGFEKFLKEIDLTKEKQEFTITMKKEK